MNIGDTQTVTVIFGNNPDPTATWTSSNPAVASISTAGPSSTCVVTGVAHGNATVTATNPGSGCQAQMSVDVTSVRQVCAGMSLQT